LWAKRFWTNEPLRIELLAERLPAEKRALCIVTRDGIDKHKNDKKKKRSYQRKMLVRKTDFGEERGWWGIYGDDWQRRLQFGLGGKISGTESSRNITGS
jgi:hypothetical protein